MMFINRRKWFISFAMIAAMMVLFTVFTYMPNSPLPVGSAQASVGDGTAATMDDFWNGNADWVYQGKDSWASTGVEGYYEGSDIEVMSDGTWYLFNRNTTVNALCTNLGGGKQMGIQVRKSTDKGITWTAPVQAIAPTSGTSYSCAATDGDAYYNATENKWHYLFQCYNNSVWQGCELDRSGSDPIPRRSSGCYS